MRHLVQLALSILIAVALVVGPAAAPTTRATAIRIDRASWTRCLMRASWCLGSRPCARPRAMIAVEAFTVAAGRDPDRAQEGPPHRFGAAKTGQVADLLEVVRRFLEEPTRRLDTGRGDEAGGGRPHLACEDPREIARAHAH